MNRQSDNVDRTADLQGRILESGRELFLKEGFSAITTERLAREAGVSKTSIYKYFGDMSGVFQAVVRQTGTSFILGVPERPESAGAFHEALIRYGENLLKLLNRPDMIQFDRMLHEEARGNPQMARLFYDTAYGDSHRFLTNLIRYGQERKFTSTRADAGQLAEYLLCMWEGLAFVRARLGINRRPFASPRERAADCVETLFGGSTRDAEKHA